MAWSIRNYNAFVREARAELELTHKQAQQLYRSLRDELERPLYGVDVKRHAGVEAEELPRITKRRRPVELAEDLSIMLDAGTELELSVETEGGFYEG